MPAICNVVPRCLTHAWRTVLHVPEAVCASVGLNQTHVFKYSHMYDQGKGEVACRCAEPKMARRMGLHLMYHKFVTFQFFQDTDAIIMILTWSIFVLPRMSGSDPCWESESRVVFEAECFLSNILFRLDVLPGCVWPWPRGNVPVKTNSIQS